MASNVVRATLLADAQRYKAGFRDAEQATQGFDKKISGTASLIKGALAGAAVVAVKRFADDSKRAFSELEQSVGGTEAVFGEASGSIDRFAKTSAQNVGLSESAFRTATTSIGGQLKRMTGDVDFAAEHSVILTEVAADLAATYGGTTAEAVSALGAAFRGEADPAERFNLDLKQGAVNAKALELGLADSTGEIDANAKAQATLALIMEQSADAQGQFEREADTLAGTEQRLNAQLENNKALVGQAIQGAYRGAMPLVSGLGNLMGELALSFMVSTGEMTKGEAALISYTNATGELVDSLEDLIPLLEEEIEKENRLASQRAQNEGGDVKHADSLEVLRERYDEMLTSLDMSHEELVKWNEEFRRSPEFIELTAEEIAAINEITREHTIAAKANEDQVAENKLRMEALAGATEDAAEETDEATSALQRYEDEVRSQVDPMFDLIEKVDALAVAQGNVTAAVDEFGEGSPEHQQALRDVARAAMELREAQLKVAEQAGMTRSEFETHLRQMGVFTDEQIDLILTDFDRLNSFAFDPKDIQVRWRQTGQLPSNIGGKAAGGPVRGGVPVKVGELGEEIFVPDQDGQIIPNHKITRGGSPVNGQAVSPTTVINIHVQALDPGPASKAVIQAIQKYIRDNGGRLPW